MNRDVMLITASWFIWGAGFYVYYPFYTVFLSNLIGVKQLSMFFILLELATLSFPVIGALISRLINIKYAIAIAMVISGIGLFLIPFSKNFVSVLITSALSYFFYAALPNYYSLMRYFGSGVLTRVWAVSVLPAVIFPLIGGITAEGFGVKYPFLIAALLTSLSGIIMIYEKTDSVKREKFVISFGKDPTPAISIIPIALVTPFIMPVLVKLYGMSYFKLGVVDAMLEGLGMTAGFILPLIGSFGLPISLFVFSLVSLTYVNWPYALSFGMREAIIPLSLDYWMASNSPESIAIVNTFQQFGWIIGYIVSWILIEPKYNFIASSFVSFLIGIVLFIKAYKRNSINIIKTK
ncbi:MAG: hypothetical protein ACP5I6_06450 [Caldisphaera sp.]|jgi:MFS family permease